MTQTDIEENHHLVAHSLDPDGQAAGQTNH